MLGGEVAIWLPLRFAKTSLTMSSRTFSTYVGLETSAWWSRLLSRLSTLISAIPKELLAMVAGASSGLGVRSATLRKRRQSSSLSAPGPGRATRCTRSGVRLALHRPSTSGRCCTFQNQLSAGMRCPFITRFCQVAKLTHPQCLIFSCHSAGTWRARSRAVTITWISKPSRESKACLT